MLCGSVSVNIVLRGREGKSITGGGGQVSAGPFPGDKMQCGQSQLLSSLAAVTCSRGESPAGGSKEPPLCPLLHPSPICIGGTFHRPGFPLGVPAPKRFGKIIGGKPFAHGTLPRRVNPTPPREGSS